MVPYALCQCIKCHWPDHGKALTKQWATDCTCTCDPNEKVGIQAKEAIWRYNDTHDDQGNECKSRSEELIQAAVNNKVKRFVIDERITKMGEFPILSFDQVKKQALGFAYGCAVTVGLAVAGELSEVESFENIGIAGLGLTALRSGASFVVLFFTQRNVGGK